MERKTKITPQEKLAYHGRLAALVLPARYVDQVLQALPGKAVTRIRNARKGIVQDMEVLQALERLSNEERGRRAGAAYLQPASA
ncbi:hypothetical protein [Hymenobacter lapidiphilus]|uniref:Uncharacterized protein n=1 Tax=Hymenobacter lapidiphilus TaxID=2608003 RepID=A0A7Y7U586_9BACT|nr:hypothetical protein [Hymenobacter lapidiphilus]NVO31198.1 hypothetical protein [Hymenobacter lapidiphilus]